MREWQYAAPGRLRILARAKSNNGPEAGGFLYEIERAELAGGIITSRLLWGSATAGTASDLLCQADDASGDANAVQLAAEWLTDLLADGAVDAKRVYSECRLNGHSVASLRRAKQEVGAKSRKDGMDGGWSWYLSRQPHTAEVANPQTLSAFDWDEHLRESEPSTAVEDLGDHDAGNQSAPVSIEDAHASRRCSTESAESVHPIGGRDG